MLIWKRLYWRRDNEFNKKIFLLGDSECTWHFSKNPKYLIVQAVDEHDLGMLDNEVKIIYNRFEESFSLVAFKINDWNSELSPWGTPAIFKNQTFGDNV